jgi:glycine dehydrogenase subunit 1
LFIASVYPISLGLLSPPGAYGADIAVAEGRCLGSPISYGGPGLGLFATTSALLRRTPGRIAGCTTDGAGRRAFTLTLQTREQHIRREKATSNICTNQGWLALRSTVHLALLGPQGLKDLAAQNLDKAHYAASRLCQIPWIHRTFDQPFFNEFCLSLSPSSGLERVRRGLLAARILPGHPLDNWYPGLKDASVWCVTETLSREAIDRAVETLRSLA